MTNAATEPMSDDDLDQIAETLKRHCINAPMMAEPIEKLIAEVRRARLVIAQGQVDSSGLSQRDRFVINSVIEWIDTVAKARGEYNKPSTADVTHSALLMRILGGRKPHTVPPPRSYSYPWYELLEPGNEGKDFQCEASVWLRGEDGVETDLLINQTRWSILKVVEPNKRYRVRYAKDYPVFEVWDTGANEVHPWRIRRMSIDVEV